MAHIHRRLGLLLPSQSRRWTSQDCRVLAAVFGAWSTYPPTICCTARSCAGLFLRRDRRCRAGPPTLVQGISQSFVSWYLLGPCHSADLPHTGSLRKFVSYLWNLVQRILRRHDPCSVQSPMPVLTCTATFKYADSMSPVSSLCVGLSKCGIGS